MEKKEKEILPSQDLQWASISSERSNVLSALTLNTQESFSFCPNQYKPECDSIAPGQTQMGQKI